MGNSSSDESSDEEEDEELYMNFDSDDSETNKLAMIKQIKEALNNRGADAESTTTKSISSGAPSKKKVLIEDITD